MKTKRILALLLSVLMILALGAPVFAEEGDTPATSLTIEGALKGNSYTVYKIFDLESYDAANGHYSYTIQKDSKLYDTVKNMKIGGQEVFELAPKDDTTYYVQLRAAFANASDDSATVKTIASNLMTAINTWNEDPANADNQIGYEQMVDYLGEAGEQRLPDADKITVTPVAGSTDKYDVKFTDLGLGYFLVDTSAGTMFVLNTTDPDATIVVKNKLPSILKQVKRNADKEWDSRNSKSIGEKVEFRLQVNVQPGATNYVLYDIISEGLTFDSITKVYYADKDAAITDYVVYDPAAGKTDMTPYFDYKTEGVEHEDQDACFQIIFKDSFLQTVLNADLTVADGLKRTIFIEYCAYVNGKAVIAGEGNPNELHMTYGTNNVEVTKSTTTTHVYEAELVKTDDKKVVLNNAKFELYTGRSNGTLTNKVSFVKLEGEEGGKTVYRVAAAGETNTVTEIEAGNVIIRGLGGSFVDNTGRTYYLKETEAPTGYNLLDAPKEFEITDTNLKAQFAADGKYDKGGVQVINKTGSLLPSTGGIGTTIFYVIGGLLVVGAAVLLITRKRVSNVEDVQR